MPVVCAATTSVLAPLVFDAVPVTPSSGLWSVSYTHLTLPTNREV